VIFGGEGVVGGCVSFQSFSGGDVKRFVLKLRKFRSGTIYLFTHEFVEQIHSADDTEA